MHASHIKTFRGHGSFTSSNLVGETHVPRNAPGTPQANARFRPARTHPPRARRARRAEGRARKGRARAEAAQKPLRGRAQAEAGWASARQKRLRQRAASSSGRSKRSGQGGGRGEAGALERPRGLGREHGGGLGENVRSPDKQREVPGQAKRTVGPRTVRLPIRDSAGSGEKSPRPPGNQRYDPADPAAVAGNAGADPLGHRSFTESA